jgi:hypothetical protein
MPTTYPRCYTLVGSSQLGNIRLIWKGLTEISLSLLFSSRKVKSFKKIGHQIQGILTEGQGLVQLTSLKFVQKIDKIFIRKNCWSKLVSTRRSTVLILPRQQGFPASGVKSFKTLLVRLGTHPRGEHLPLWNALALFVMFMLECIGSSGTNTCSKS